MPETKSRQCGQPQPEPTAMTDYITCYCSLPVGHAGEHTSIVHIGHVRREGHVRRIDRPRFLSG
jgi:hypothetical protein